MSEQALQEPATDTAVRDADQTPEHLKHLARSVQKSNGLLGPNDVADHLAATIDELGLADALAHFREHGYAMIEDVASHQEMDALREAIHGLADQASDVPGLARAAPYLLGRHPAVDRIATKAKILAFAEVSVGNGFRASQIAGSITPKGNENAGVHADQNWLPAPFPEHNCVITFCIPCEGMTADDGATRVVPDSHLLRRHPTPDETRSETVPIEVPKGGVAVWDGSVWHGAGQRKADGVRTVLHATYQRLYTQPIDDYSYLLRDEAYLASAPEGMRQLLGDGLFFGTSSVKGIVDMGKFREATIRSKL